MTMNIVVSPARAMACRFSCRSAGISKWTSPPAIDRRSVRGRSVGMASSSGAPARVERQKSIWAAANESGSSGDPMTARCQIAKSAYWTLSGRKVGDAPVARAV